MSNRSRRNRQSTSNKNFVQTGDSFQNFLTRTGVGTGNAQDGSTYGFNPVSRNRIVLENAYRGSWICGIAVDAVAEDMTRAGCEVQSDDDPDTLKQLEKEISRLQVWPVLCQTSKWSRLYGGAIAFMMIDGQKPETPLRLDTVGKDQFKGLISFDRWMVQPSLNDLVDEQGPDFAMPKYYDTVTQGTGLPRMRMHYSRVIRLDGVELPFWQRIAENGWGQSVLERLWDRVIAFDSGTAGASQLLYKAHLRTYKVEGLRDIIAVGGPAQEALIKQINMIRQYQSNEGLTLMDSKDEFETHQYAFSGVNDVIMALAQQLSGALQIPLVRLFGQSPSGLNSSEEADLRTYYDGINAQQEARLRSGVEKIYGLTYRSKFGKAPKDNMEIGFKPLWQMTDEQKADITTKRTSAVTDAYDSQIIDRGTALKELKAISRITGQFSNITDEQIREAEAEPPPGLAELGLENANENPGSQAQQGQQAPGENQPGRAKLRAAT